VRRICDILPEQCDSYGSLGILGTLTWAFLRRADEGIRTRDPHLGKVVKPPGHKSVTAFYEPFRASDCHLVTRVAKP
jgi:hypothetical protein